MNDQFQEAWQSQPDGSQIRVDADLLLREVRRNQRSFRATILRRDILEIGVAGVLIFVFLVPGLERGSWPLLLLSATMLWVAGFLVVDRWQQRRKVARSPESVVSCVEASLREVEHQIWLLKNVLWWYLLPPGVALLVFFNYDIRAGEMTTWLGCVMAIGMSVFCVVLYAGIYWLNQRAVRVELEPRRQELLAVRDELMQLSDDEESLPPSNNSKKRPHSMSRMFIYLIVALLAAIFPGTFRYVQLLRLADPASAAGEPPAVAEAELDGARNVSEVLERIRSEHKLPALAAAMVKDGHVVALGAAGVRRAGGTEHVGIHDQFHLGSCTKAMTAMLSAILIEEGKLRWDSTVGEVFGDQADKLRPEYRNVTLEQLLTHRSGLPEDVLPDRELWPKIVALKGPMLDQRRKLVELALSREPAATPGTKYQYSNIGYAIAGAMCERVTNKTWEELMRERVFQPLGMTTAGFGPPGTADRIDQPWGHLVGAGWTPMPPGAEADNPAVIGPAGTVHCSLADWAKFATVYLRPEASQKLLASADTLRKLKTSVPGEDYAFGWLVRDRGWAGGRALMHTGSNTMWYADVWLAPERGTAYLAATNVGTDRGFLGCDAAISALIVMADTLPKRNE